MKPADSRRKPRGDRLFVAALILVLGLMIWTVADLQRRNATAVADRPAMRSIDPAVLQQGIQSGQLSDHPARFFKPVEHNGGRP